MNIDFGVEKLELSANLENGSFILYYYGMKTM